ncbi:MAG TPA: transglycosylase SLT domain-containing protein [Alphaproteobacteria bacterium]|nr:transglycosylase SLT domain-containing protein [Alphaproteobacteria bacterium]
MPNRIMSAIKSAAAKTGVDFTYLMQKASQESGFDPNAKASSSSATGLFQFTNQTWLQTLKEHGGQYGLSSYADHIQVDSSGVAHVNDPAMKKVILGLRKDPEVSAEMAGELDKDNLDTLKSNVGGKIGKTDLYLAHFLGAGGASEFLNAMRQNPSASGASILPDAAAANPSVFYNASGEPRTIKQIYSHFAQKFDGNATVQVANVATTNSTGTDAANAASLYSRHIAATSYSMANNAYSSATPTIGGYTSPVMGSDIKLNGTSSLMATMIMAQMNIDNASAESMRSSALSSPEHSKKDALAILGAIG